jgi:excisionase family DNA binding protein
VASRDLEGVDHGLLLTVEEVAWLLGISRKKAFVLVGRREIGSLKIGRSRRIPREAYAEFVARRYMPAC